MNIKKIAELANVSVATVSRVINNDSKVKKSTKEKIENIISQFNYTPNCHATRLSKGVADKTIGLIIPDVSNILFSEMVEVISNCAEKENITILLCNTNGEYQKEKKFIELFIDYRVKGIVYIPGKFETNKEYDFLKEVELQNMPLVFLDREVDGFNFDGVFLDNFNISYNITKEILKNNYNKLYFISGSLDISSGKNRYLGFKSAMEKHKRNLDTYEIKYGDFKFESGYQLGKEILKNHTSDELVIYVANNTMALGFLKILKKYKSKFKKIIIAVFGISEVLDMLLDDENYITCKVPNKEIAEKSFHTLIDKIKNQNKKNIRNKKIFYSTTIIKKGDEF
ncbi:MAG: LacI family DNA-binding transcriptional regulator [Sarcina sp.]|uniref:LacI family DNA-binding transcriptional regulator n=1 Tax=Cetobacterium sp. TaxID=2071632 RepID=UPI003F316A73